MILPPEDRCRNKLSRKSRAKASRRWRIGWSSAGSRRKFRGKTDVSDCQWLQTLHTFGLLQGSFRPHENIVTLRSYLRHRDNLVKCATDEVRRMQKALEQMNVKLTEVISDIMGVTRLSIIRAILAAERDPQRLWLNCETSRASRLRRSSAPMVPTAHCPSPIAHRPSPIAHRPLPIAHRPLSPSFSLLEFSSFFASAAMGCGSVTRTAGCPCQQHWENLAYAFCYLYPKSDPRC
jgi:hypothetical protein